MMNNLEGNNIINISDYRANYRTKLIHQIINTSRDINEVYKKMNFKNKNILLEKLKLLITKENKLLSQLNITNLNSKEIYNEFSECLFSLRDDNLKSNILDCNLLILKRFESYLIYKFIPTFLNKKCMKDSAIIQHYATLDLNTSIIKFLDDFENRVKCVETYNSIMYSKNQLLFKEKEIELKYIKDNLENYNYKNTIIDEFNKDLVNCIYDNIINEHIEQHLTSCIIYPNKSLKKKKEIIEFKIILENFKAGLYLLDQSDLERKYLYYYNIYSQSSVTSTKHILKGIKDVLYIKNFERDSMKK